MGPVKLRLWNLERNHSRTEMAQRKVPDDVNQSDRAPRDQDADQDSGYGQDQPQQEREGDREQGRKDSIV